VKLPRREFLYLAAGSAALSAASRMAWAQTYPSRPGCKVAQGLQQNHFQLDLLLEQIQ